MPTLTLTVGKEYGRNDGRIPLTIDFSDVLVAGGSPPNYRVWAIWESPTHPEHVHPGRGRLAQVVGQPITAYQGAAPINGLSLHGWNTQSENANFSLIGIPLEVWTGHRIHFALQCFQDDAVHEKSQYVDLVFVSDPVNYPPTHSPASIGPGHWHPDKDEWERMKTRVAALETDAALRKGAAGGNSGSSGGRS